MAEGGQQGRAGIPDVSMFLPYMAKRDGSEPTTDIRWNVNKNGDNVNPINLESSEDKPLGDDVRCVYAALRTRVRSSSNTSRIVFQFRRTSRWDEPCHLKLKPDH
jgi:hypothetical protein